MGGGAVGGYYGFMLARAGAPVALVGREAHVAAIRAQGLRITSPAFDEQVRMEASTDPGLLRDSDIVLFCTKTRDTGAGAVALQALLNPSAIVLAFQNGIDGAQRLASILPHTIFPAALCVSCQIIGPGHVRHNGRGDVTLGEHLPGRPDAGERLRRLRSTADVLDRASISTTVVDDIRAVQWTKLAMNCAYNAISALGRARYQRLAATEPSRTLMRQVVLELLAVAKADGVGIDPDIVMRQVMDLAGGMPEAISSTGQDILAGRPTEVDDLNGYVVRRGQALGINTPVNETLRLLISVLEQSPPDPGFDSYRWKE